MGAAKKIQYRKFSGAKLREKREAAELTQSELAEACGTMKQAVSRYELGLVEPDLATAVKFAHHLAVDLNDLLH